jgi:membrane dipeptidase
MEDCSGLEIYREAIGIDMACPLASYKDCFELWIRGGATSIAVTVTEEIEDDIAPAIQKTAAWLQRIESGSHRLLLVRSVEDIYRAKREDRLGIMMAFQNTRMLGKDLNMIRVYYQLGARVIQLCYNTRNDVGDGCAERTDAGLSIFGESAIREMERVGIAVDLSHTGYRTTMEAMEVCTKPPIFSHSNAKALCDSRRNITDDQIRSIARKGGVIGLTGYPGFLGRRHPSMNDLLDHADHIIKVAGIDHVGLGIDYYEGMAGIADPKEARELYDRFIAAGTWAKEEYPPPPWHYPQGIDRPDTLYNIGESMKKRGYSRDNMRQLLGGNWVRVLGETWR